MNMNVSKTNTGKLLVAVMALAVVLAGAVVVFSDSEVSADTTTVSDLTELKAAITADAAEIIIDGNIDMSAETSPLQIDYSVTIKGDVSGNAATIKGNPDANVSAIEVTGNGTVTLEKLVFTDFGKNMTGNAVILAGSDATPFSGTITIKDCVVQNFGKGGIVVKGGTASITNTTVDVTDNRSDKSADRAPNGIQIDQNATATITKCTIKNSKSTTDEWTATGILALRGGVANVNEATLTNCQTGFDVDEQYGNGAGTGNSISESTFDGCATAISAGKSTTVTDSVFNNETSIDGTIVFEGTNTINGILTNNATATNNGTFAISNNTEIKGTNLPGKVASSITESDTSTGLQNYIDSDFTIPSGGAYLTQNLTIKSGATLTVPSKAELNLNGFKLIVEGTLAVERNGVVAALPTGTEQGIYLSSNGAIQNEGVIGTAKTPVTVGVWTNNAVDADAGYVELLNVNGVNFSIVKDGVGAEAEYYLNVNGDVSRASGTTSKDTMTFTINGATVKGDLTVSKDVTLAGEFNVDRNSTVTVNGPLSADVTLKNGASITVNGVFGADASIIAETAEGIAADAENPDLDETTITNTISQNVSATGFTVSVSRVQYTDDNGDVMFNQRAYLSGNIDVVTVDKDTETPKDATATLTISGNIFVAADTTVVLDNVILSTRGTPAGLIIVDGTIQNVGETVPEFAFVGAYYSITAEGETDGVRYITSFDKAMGTIATVDDMTITVSGTENFYAEVTGTYELAMDQTIELNPDSAAYIAIAESGKITVNDGAVLAPGALKEIDGLLVVMDGGDCEPEAELYDVMSSNEAGDVTYSGFQVVLNNAQPGDEITVTGNADATNVTIPNGVTVIVQGSLTVDRTVTVAEGGKLVLDGGALTVGTVNEADATKNVPGKLTVNGEADVTEGTVSMIGGSDENKATIDSTGSYIYYTNPVSATVQANGATYANADGFTVLTTFSKAVAGAVEAETLNVTVIGTVTDTTDVTLGGANVTVTGKATLGNINVAESKLTVTGGELTATIVGQYGEDGSTGTASIVLNKAVITGVTNEAKVNAQNVNVWALTFAGITSGTVEIAQGTVVAGDMTGTNSEKTKDALTVASGATLEIAKDKTVAIDGYNTVTVAGTLNVIGTLNVGQTAGVEKFVVSGTMTVDGSASVKTITVTGTLNVTDNETTTGTMAVSVAISVGEASETLGATGAVNGTVTLSGNAYALAYPGTTVAASNFGNESSVNSTQFYINGALYVTAYATGSAVAIGEDGFMEDVEITGFVTSKDNKSIINTVTNWFEDEAMEIPLTGNTFNVGGKNAVYIQLEPANAGIKYSVGTGISLYVDGIKVDSSSVAVPISVGTHTVTATVNPGYAGEVTITFNGQAITSGTFEVTPEMAKTGATAVVLSATGNITVDTGSTSGGDSGMGLTEILLIILVVLIVIMAIMVALRLMRS